jgi:hypothetical protein
MRSKAQIVIASLGATVLIAGCGGEETPSAVTSERATTSTTDTSPTVLPSGLRLRVEGDCAEVVGAEPAPEVPVCAEGDYDWVPGNMMARLDGPRPFMLFYFGADNLVGLRPPTYPRSRVGNWLLVGMDSAGRALPLPTVAVRDPFGNVVQCTFDHFSAECA